MLISRKKHQTLIQINQELNAQNLRLHVQYQSLDSTLQAINAKIDKLAASLLSGTSVQKRAEYDTSMLTEEEFKKFFLPKKVKNVRK